MSDFPVQRRMRRQRTSGTGGSQGISRNYDEVVSSIRDADAILILGPGEAKGELKARLESEALGGRLAGVEAVDKMTDQQIEAKVREYFAPTGKTHERP